MAEQSRLARLGLRLGVVGLSTSLAIAAPLASGNYNPTCHTDAARIGWYFDRATSLVSMIVGGIGGEAVSKTASVSANWVLNSPNPTMTIGDGTGQVTVNGNSTTNIATGLQIRVSGNFRWTVLKNSTSESGGNAGSGLSYGAWDDAGTFIDQPLFCQRVAGSSFAASRPFTVSPSTLTTNLNSNTFTVTLNNAGVTFNTGLFRVAVTDTLSNTASLIFSCAVNTVVINSVRKDGYYLSFANDNLTSPQITYSRAFTLTGNLTDPFQYNFNAVLNGAFTVTRYSWFDLNTPTGAATITNATVFSFDAAPGTHKCIDAGTTKITPSTVSAWIKHNINGTVYFSNAYTSKTT